MGRWAQASRRGGGIAPAAAIGPPPAPLLSLVQERLLQLATGGDDTGGGVVIECRADPEVEWEFLDALAWSASVDWGPQGNFAGFYWRVKEVGNGVAYVGDSPYSEVLDLT